MVMSRIVVPMMLSSMMVLGAASASAQDYPTKPIRVLTSTAGGASDILARLLAQGASGPLGQPLIVENRPILLSIEGVAKAPPDGYTLLLFGSLIWLAPFLRENPPWDPVRDFSPVTLLVNEVSLLVVHPSVPVKTVKELIALAKARPGELNYGSGPSGAPGHLSMELFKSMAGVNLTRVSYKASNLGVFDTVAGNVQVMFASSGNSTPFIKAGRLRALATTSAQPSPLAPGVPTVSASGLPGFEALSMNGVLAPGKTSTAIINRLNQEMVRVMSRPDVKEKFFGVGQEVVASTPEGFAAAIKADMTRMGKVIKDAGIRED